jgi:hypothetical protein
MPIILDGTNGAFLPTWTTATRPASPANGEIGYNSTTAQLDQYVGGAWSSVPTGSAAAATPTVLGTVYGKTNSAGNENCAGGYQALNVSTGTKNCAFGTYAGFQISTGTYNTLFGNQSGGGITTASENVGVGYQALASLTTAGGQTAVGHQAGYSNSTASQTSFFGYLSGYSVTGEYNAGFGAYTLNSTTSGVSNTATGTLSLRSNTTGSYNVASGMQAAYSNSTDAGIVAIGYQALYNNTTGSGDSQNVAVGRQAMYTNSIGYYSVAVGYRALYAFNNNGGYNVAVGYQAMAQATTAGACTAVGYRAGYGLTGGSGGNTFFGQNAGSNITTGSYNTFIGTDSSAAGATDGSEIVLGNNSVGKGSNTAFINPNGGGVYAGNNSSNFSTTSDQRLKKNIVDNNEGLDKIAAIRIRNFEYRLPEEVTELPTHSVIKKSGVQLGVIAQELQAVLPECVKQESTGVLTVDSDNLTWYLINAVKELKSELDALKAKVA